MVIEHFGECKVEKRVILNLNFKKFPQKYFLALGLLDNSDFNFWEEELPLLIHLIYAWLQKRRNKEENKSSSSEPELNLYKDYTKVKPLASSSEEENKVSQNSLPDSSEDEEVFRKEQVYLLTDSKNFENIDKKNIVFISYCKNKTVSVVYTILLRRMNNE